jgi:hypothetical protein
MPAVDGIVRSKVICSIATGQYFDLATFDSYILYHANERNTILRRIHDTIRMAMVFMAINTLTKHTIYDRYRPIKQLHIETNYRIYKIK